jgi:hypothetical protein
MIIEVVTCYHCGSENIVRDGKAPNGKQKYLCRDCGRQSREDPASNAYIPHTDAKRSCVPTRIPGAFQLARSHSHLRGGPQHRHPLAQKKLLACRLWLRPCCPRRRPKRSCSNSTSCCARSCERKPTNAGGLDCPGSTQPPSGGLRDRRSRRKDVAQVMGSRIPESYKRGGRCYSDFWEAYRGVIPEVPRSTIKP